MIFVPAPGAADSILEAADAGIELIVCITEGIPVIDMMRAKVGLRDKKVRLIGPNCPGIITPRPVQDRHHARLHPQARQSRRCFPLRHPHLRGGLAAHPRAASARAPASASAAIRSTARATPTPSACSTRTPDTEAIILIGEIGGTAEEDAAEYIKKHVKKPVAAFIAGATAPPGRRMGHAGAIVSGGKGTAEGKIQALEAAGIAVARTPAEMADTLIKRMK